MSPLDNCVIRYPELNKLIREIDKYMAENNKEGAEATYKRLVDRYNHIRFWTNMDVTAKYYYIDIIDIYERKLRHHVYKSNEPETLADKVDRLV